MRRGFSPWKVSGCVLGESLALSSSRASSAVNILLEAASTEEAADWYGRICFVFFFFFFFFF